MNLSWKYILNMSLLGLLFLFVGCSDLKTQPTNSGSTTIPSKSITFISDFTETPTQAETNKSTSTQVGNIINLPGETPSPTLLPDEAVSAIKELLRTNGMCEFPCWWGFTPGRSNILEVKSLLLPMAIDSSKGRYNFEEKDDYLFVFPVEDNPIDMNKLWVYFVVDRKTKIIESIKTSQDFSAKGTVEKLGIPDKIFIDIPDRVGEVSAIYEIIILYEKLGILANISGEAEFLQKNGEDYFVLCPLTFQEKERGTGFIFWDPKMPKTVRELLNYPSEDFPFEEVEKISNLDTEELYYLLIASNSDKCLEIPIIY